MVKTIKVSDFIDTKYREFWNESNFNRNVFYDYEQLMTIERRIIWSAYKIGMTNLTEHFKTLTLSGEVAKYHIAGNSSIEDSIKGIATSYKRQKAVRILKGIGNMGTSPSDPGAAARYTSVCATPLLLSMIKDLKYVPFVEDETGLKQPKFISTPIPMVLINGCSAIGTGKAAYYDERDANEIIDWIEALSKGEDTSIPDPISTTGCEVYKKDTNGYTYYEAVMHTEKKYDIITALPPKTSSDNVIAILQKKLPPKIADKIIDGSGKGRPTWIMIPKGNLDYNDWTKYGLKLARKEAPYIWDEENNTVRMSDFESIALSWLNKRREIVSKRLNSQIKDNDDNIHKIDLIKIYVEKEMNKWTVLDIEKEFGKEDADIVLKQSAYSFLPENVKKNEIKRIKLVKENDDIKFNLDHIDDFIFEEARNIIKEQEKFFSYE